MLKAQVSFSDCPLVYLYTFHIFFSFRTTGPISTKLGTECSLLMGIQFFTYMYVGPCTFRRGDNDKIANILWRNLKIFFSRATGPISTKLGTKHSWVKRIQVSSNEGSCPCFSKRNYSEIAKNMLANCKIFLLQNHWAIFNPTYWHKWSILELRWL